MNTSISFIIPCYNCSDTIEEAVMSLINTNLVEGDEIILINDASTDDTNSKLLSFTNRFPFIKLLKHNINKGTAAAARNTGIDASANDLIFCLDADNILLPDTIKQLKTFLLDNNLDAAAFGRIDHFRKAPKQIEYSWALAEKLNFIEALNKPTTTPCGSGNYLYTKAIWKKVGRYNESVGGAYDSELFGLKLLAEGAKFWTLQGVSYLHRFGYDSTFVKEYNKRNTSLLFLSALINYWDQIHEDDVEYIFGRGRYNWMDNIESKPLRPRSTEQKTMLQKLERKIKRRLIKALQ